MKKILSILLLMLTLFLSGCMLFNFEDDFEQVNGCSDMENCALFSSGLLAVKKGEQYGYINTSGEIVIDYAYNSAFGFYGKNAIVQLGDLYYLIDKKGELITEGYEFLLRDIQTGMVIYNELDKQGLMDRNGKVVIEAMYDDIAPSSEALFLVKTNFKYGFIDLKGNQVIEPEYDFAASFSYGLARIKIGSKFGFIDSANRLVIDAVFDDADDFDRYHRAIVKSGMGEYSGLLIDQSGNPVLQGYNVISRGGPIYNVHTGSEIKLYDYQGEAFAVETDLFIYYLDGYYGRGIGSHVIFNTDGSILDELGYMGAQREFFIDTLDPGKIILARINQEDRIISFTYQGQRYEIPGDDIANAYKLFLVIYRGDKVGVVDYDNNTVINFYYDAIYYTVDGYFLYEVDGKYGIMDKEGNLIVNAQFDDINPDIN